jgi:predicted metalloprotease with PDZ domain
MDDFFKRYVRGVETPPYEEAFRNVGLRFVREPRTPVTLGISADQDDARGFKIGSVRPASPAAEAGLQPGDIISSFGGVRFSSVNFLKVLARYKPGDRVQVSLLRHNRPVSATVVLGAPQVFDYRIEKLLNASAEANLFRAAWLSGK